ncbi:unannotated protein [freshwater metagenome]|uniref:Unannotated protein n=1 Tax=freshwater metagenome TaxID=449393 RepID=A0A6J7I3A5_9ZZZZ
MPEDFFTETFFVGSATTTGAAGVVGVTTSSVTVVGVEIARSET